MKKNYIDVEMEVFIRKYEVDIQGLMRCLADHKRLTNQQIANALGKPQTMVEHWFRKDKWFAIPDADLWLDLKRLLGIQTDEFDESIMTFEDQGGGIRYAEQNILWGCLPHAYKQ